MPGVLAIQVQSDTLDRPARRAVRWERLAMVTEILLMAVQDGKFSGSNVVVIAIGSLLLWIALGKGRR